MLFFSFFFSCFYSFNPIQAHGWILVTLFILTNMLKNFYKYNKKKLLFTVSKLWQEVMSVAKRRK